MKKIAITLSLLAITSLVASDDIRTEIALTAGYNKFDSASIMENASVFGIRGTMYENEVNKYGLQVGYEGATGVKFTDSSEQTDLHRIFTHLVVDGEEEYRVVPYLFLGGGYEFLSEEIKGEPSQGFIDLGLGFKYFFDNNVKALLETRAIGKFDTRDLGFNVNVGLGYAFGGKQHTTLEPIMALGSKESMPKPTTAPKTAINIIKVPMAQTTNPMDKLTAMVNEIDASTPTPSHTTSTVSETASTYDKTTNVASGSYYVQMAALNITSTEPLVNRLHNKGYDNTVVHQRDNTQLVLVGPYVDSTEAKDALHDLKAMKHDAFITKMK